ncbi:MAG: hypothetical protein AAF902_08030 [Chloroflexota bacterium]
MNDTYLLKNIDTTPDTPALEIIKELKNNQVTDDELVGILKGMEFLDSEILEALMIYGLPKDDIENGIEAWDMLETVLF